MGMIHKRQIPSTAGQHFLGCLDRAVHISRPYDYWLLDRVLPESVIDNIVNLPFLPPSGAVFDGRRERNNSTRVYFTGENQERFRVCRDVAVAFSDPAVIRGLERLTGAELQDGFLRIEYCQDVDGFWLEPHVDISVKLFTMLIYLSDDPNLFDAGTDIYDGTPAHRLVATAPYERNHGLIFVPGKNTWHGFSKRPIHGLRKSLIINYVSAAWRNRDELAYE